MRAVALVVLGAFIAAELALMLGLWTPG